MWSICLNRMRTVWIWTVCPNRMCTGRIGCGQSEHDMDSLNRMWTVWIGEDTLKRMCTLYKLNIDVEYGYAEDDLDNLNDIPKKLSSGYSKKILKLTHQLYREILFAALKWRPGRHLPRVWAPAAAAQCAASPAWCSTVQRAVLWTDPAPATDSSPGRWVSSSWSCGADGRINRFFILAKFVHENLAKPSEVFVFIKCSGMERYTLLRIFTLFYKRLRMQFLKVL